MIDWGQSGTKVSDHVNIDDRFCYVDDLQMLELIMMKGILQDNDIFSHIGSDVP